MSRPIDVLPVTIGSDIDGADNDDADQRWDIRVALL